MSGASESQDRIEREILIDAPIELVWRLVSRPGWWIGDEDREGQTITRERDHVIVDDPRYGRWVVLTVSSQAPHHVSYRSPEAAEQALEEGSSTLVEFLLAEHGSGTRLRVVESGFASLPVSAEGRAAKIEGNSRGWQVQLGFAKREAERVST